MKIITGYFQVFLRKVGRFNPKRLFQSEVVDPFTAKKKLVALKNNGHATPVFKKTTAMKTVLITGASGGIGLEFALIFAKKSFNLVLAARSENKLAQIAKDLEKEYDIGITVLPFDLSIANSATELYTKIINEKIRIDILINNAGFGNHGNFVGNEMRRTIDMINLNITTLTELSLLFVKEMKARNHGKILNVSSTASFQPIPRFAVYAATKSYVLSFTEALHYELKGTNVSVSALCPGPTSTGFEKTANVKNSDLFENGMNAQVVAQIGYNGLMKNKMTIIPGFKNKLLAILANMTPSRSLLVWVSAKMT